MVLLVTMSALAVSCGEKDTPDPQQEEIVTAKGIFSISESTHIKFAKGNLTYTNGKFSSCKRQCDYGDYFAFDIIQDSITDDSSHSQIEGGWRNLKRSEWQYLLTERPNANNLFGHACVCGIKGLVILPDDWSHWEYFASFNVAHGFDSNQYNESGWSIMEDLGAIFLPAAGYSNGDHTLYEGDLGYYWTPDKKDSNTAYNLFFDGNTISVNSYNPILYQFPVRLAREEKEK